MPNTTATTPEAQARVDIDAQLTAAGWAVQDPNAVNLGAARGVAVREFHLATGYADYLLFVDRRPIGVIEAKAGGATLSGVNHQSQTYAAGLPSHLTPWHNPLPFLYESTGVETQFANLLDPDPRSRAVFSFHKPETLAHWAATQPGLRARLHTLPPLVPGDLWPAQIEAITHLEHSLAQDRPRALIQMATGSGKTFTAVNFIYRLIKHADAKRILFLVDRSNLGRQTYGEFSNFTTPDDGRKFTDLYNVQHMRTNKLDGVARVCITTVQRLYSMLCGEEDFDAEAEELSMYNGATPQDQQPKTVAYNPALPIETFDFIVTDECHRSIYNLWRQVLEYFDAYLIGLTATPSKQTFGFFNNNLVMEYTRQRAVADGVNVDGEVYRIRTRVTEQGGQVRAGYWVGRRDRLTRQQRWEQLDEDLTYSPGQLDRDVATPDQIRTIIRTYRDRLFTEIFPGRAIVPKTLIFAKDDAHAETIVNIVRQEFGKGNAFCQKITYRVSGTTPEQLVQDFRNSYNPRIAVTVDMIATGTDIKPLEVLIFMRIVRSRVLYEQMLGRGTRVIQSDDLRAVTGDAMTKDRFVIVDAVGVTDNPLFDPKPVERKRHLSFAKLLDDLAVDAYDEDSLSSLAGRLARLAPKLGPDDTARVQALSGGLDLNDLSRQLLDALDPDAHRAAAQAAHHTAEPTDEQIDAAAADAMQHAARLFADNPALRETLKEAHRRSEQTIDETTLDTVLSAGFDQDATARARTTVESFRQFIEDNKDEIDALQLLYSRPYAQRAVTHADIQALGDLLRRPPYNWTTEQLWRAYAQLERDKVHGVNAQRLLTDLISLVRHAVGLDAELMPYPAVVRRRYQQWLADHAAAGRAFTAEQRWWLDRIADRIGIDLQVTPDDFDYGDFADHGGRFGAVKALGSDWLKLVAELNTVLQE